jgi:hypothetical protein
LLAGFHLEVEVRSGKALQTSRDGGNLLGVERGTTAKFNDDFVNGGLSHAILRKVGQCRQSLAREKESQSAIAMLDDAPRPTLQIVDCRSIVPAWALCAQAGKVIQITANCQVRRLPKFTQAEQMEQSWTPAVSFQTCPRAVR